MPTGSSFFFTLGAGTRETAFGKPAKSKEETFLVIKRHTKNWTIPWMPTIELKDNFETSKSFLFGYLVEYSGGASCYWQRYCH
jgi:hypothetical protein